ncbi:unnamed protein product [Nippostrongylus brasiliensis]|uniref:Isochorismatase domain-containing protein n=1 Tax=Nippostrongylus brasiliensis TaxID=27835 RepID=A0A0N4YRR1_NIPBR|nr:unnamed protein product [Nippostrongylus brasiliensis]
MPQWEGDATIKDVSVQDISDGLVLLDKHHIFETVKRIAKRATHLSTDRLCAMQKRVFRELSSLKIALLVVDFQNDFISGSLRVQDWHPENHISFIGAAGDPDRKFMHNYRVRDLEPFDRVAFKVPSTVQILYPAHCVQGSWGAKIHESISIPADAEFVKKGTNVLIDSYSAFRDNSGHKIFELLLGKACTFVVFLGQQET